MKFYRCLHCKNIVEMVDDKGVTPVCCGEKMEELIPGTSDGAAEKHVPEYTVEGDTVCVTVGSVEHPMLDVHYIQFIAIETKQGSQIKYLAPEQAPKAEFKLSADDEVKAVYAYCNLHGLWMA